MPVRVLPILAALTGSASADPIRHVPPAGAEAAAAFELVAEAPAETPALTLHYRTLGTQAFTTQEFVRRDPQSWVAVVPPAAVTPPGLEYYIDAGTDAVFASSQWPHTTPVNLTDSGARRARDTARSEGRRSRIHLAGEYVDFGSHTVDGVKLADSYYRIDADFAYKLWTYPLEEVRVGYTRLLGDNTGYTCDNPPCGADAGFKVAGWFELGLAPVEGFRLDGRVMVMATQGGFAVGVRAEGRLGSIDASHIALGVESMADVGTNGYVRLGWGTVPGLPMAATVEITNLPESQRSTGVRLFYDIARSFGHGVRVGLRVGYAARNQTIAGFTSGANANVDF